MGTLYLVRHGQASFGAANYDQLSALGQRQSHQLGRYFGARARQFDLVLTGTLARHSQTLDEIARGAQTRWPAQRHAGLNEYDSRAVIEAAAALGAPNPTAPISTDVRRDYVAQLRRGLLQWMLGQIQPQGMPSWREFQQAIVDVLAVVRQSGAQQVLLVSSGGPIACAIGHVLATPPEATIELNLRLRNTSVTEFAFSPQRCALQTFNTITHLDDSAFDGWITHL